MRIGVFTHGVLYAQEYARGKGVGKRLVDECIAFAGSRITTS